MNSPRTAKAAPLPLTTHPRWLANRAQDVHSAVLPPLATAVARGLANRCPVCGQGRLFHGFLAVAPACSVCATPLGLVRADDAPPYFTIVAVGHVVIPGMLIVERTYQPALWIHAMIWLPLTLVMALLLLRPIKGGTVGLMLKLGLMKSADE